MQASRTQLDNSEIDRAAFNAAFFELGLRWHWDSRTYESLTAHDCERRRVFAYVQAEQAHLLRAYDADFLTDAILRAKQRSRPAMAPGPTLAMPRFDGAVARCDEVGA